MQQPQPVFALHNPWQSYSITSLFLYTGQFDNFCLCGVFYTNVCMCGGTWYSFVSSYDLFQLRSDPFVAMYETAR